MANNAKYPNELIEREAFTSHTGLGVYGLKDLEDNRLLLSIAISTKRTADLLTEMHDSLAQIHKILDIVATNQGLKHAGKPTVSVTNTNTVKEDEDEIPF